MLVLDDGALALWNAALPEVTVLNAEWLVPCVVPVEADKTNHIKVLIVLLKSTLESWNLRRLTCCVSDLIEASRPASSGIPRHPRDPHHGKPCRGRCGTGTQGDCRRHLCSEH